MFTHSERQVKHDVHCQSHDAEEGWGDNPGMAKAHKKQSNKDEPGEFGRNLKVLRDQRKWTQDHLAIIASVSKSYISSLEGGSRANPSEGLARRFADVFGCEVADLWGRDQSSFEARALVLLRSIPEEQREAAIGALYGIAASSKPKAA